MTADGMTTRMRFVLSDGVTPNQVTIGGRTGSSWKLVTDADSPTGYRWDPE